MSIVIVPFGRVHVADAARMFVDSLSALCRRVPALPPDLADVAAVSRRLEGMTGFAAIEEGRLAGYLTGWAPIERFRGAARVGAYVPEWAHASRGPNRRDVDTALYRAAAAGWSAAGSDTHAITLLAGDDALETWFWLGFGMGTVDAVRPMTPLERAVPDGVVVRPATPDDAGVLATLDVEHQRHYRESPIFMAAREPEDPGSFAAFVQRPGATIWLAEIGDEVVGFLRCGREFNASAVVESDAAIFISAAYVRPVARGRGVATAMLDAALRQYAAEGFTTCAVDFEAFNPEATAFWLRFFTPVCFSLMRVPEASTAELAGRLLMGRVSHEHRDPLLS
ncbi:MAG TPA: GNAT family N-acetyltransferase [Patescibacteria group bacterium]|nr:GNAT family N-acetyltransferase [Patescibacteria group bacterium]